MLIHSASQLLTLQGGVQVGKRLGELAIINNGAVLIEGEKIVAVGETTDLLNRYLNEPAVNANGCVVMPGLVDPHTHLVWAGERSAEFEMRLEGKSYLEIMAAGGGILSTMRATREASLEDLIAQTRSRCEVLFANGTTTAEVKTGYGLSLESELRQLEAILELENLVPLELVPTFLGAHAIPPEFEHDPDGFVSLICEEMLPELRSWWERRVPQKPLPFVDVFCEQGAFDLQQSERILLTAQNLGFPVKIHADEFANLGGVRMAASMGAVSADHLVKTTPDGFIRLANSGTVAVALPATPFGLGDCQHMSASAVLEAGGILAIASDINPGPAWCESMQFVIALACRFLRLTPAQAIAAATINAAAAIDLQQRIGSVEPGKQADLLILSVSDYRHLGYRFGGNLVRSVIKKGELHELTS